MTATFGAAVGGRFTATCVHAPIPPARRTFPSSSPTGDGVVLRPKFDPLVNGALLALISHYKVFATFVDHWGWGPGADTLQFWEDRINAVFPDALT